MKTTKEMRDHIALFQTLKELKPYQRQIIVDHLNPKACECLQECVRLVMKTGVKRTKKKKPTALMQKFQKAVKQNPTLFKHLLSRGKAGQVPRQMAQVGGFPLGFILSTAIPMLMNLIKK